MKDKFIVRVTSVLLRPNVAFSIERRSYRWVKQFLMERHQTYPVPIESMLMSADVLSSWTNSPTVKDVQFIWSRRFTFCIKEDFKS